ncbi:RNA helicase [Gracilaria domingensis]|nr:RNA helicase [Gracilaria domingensis]
MTKRKRRVSFVLPDKKQDSTEEQTVSICYANGDEFDDDIETASPVGDGDSDEEESHADVSGTDDQRLESNAHKESLTEAEHKEKGLTKRSTPKKRGRRTEKKLPDFSTEDASDVDDESDSTDSDSSSSDRADDFDENEVSEDSDSSSSASSDSESESSEGEKQENIEKAPTPIRMFTEMGLDPRLESAIERMEWKKPTPIQSAVIPAALHGRDVLVSSPTGSGKTAAYAVPVIQHICKTASVAQGLRAVVLVPTRELVHQVTSVLKGLSKYIDGIHIAALTGSYSTNFGKNGKKDEDKTAFARSADVMVGTPAAIVSAAGTGMENFLSTVEFVVVDEADLVLSYGYEQDARAALSKVPMSAQSMLLSATLEAEGMDKFKKVILRRPLTIKISASDSIQEDEAAGATHYYARLKIHRDRYLVTYAMLRLNVITGKVLIFVNHISTAFRLKLFLDQFKVKSAVLNSELPMNSRVHCVEQFNAGVFDILIATDEAQDDSGKEKQREKKEKRSRKRVRKDFEFGLSRGVDFRDVAAVFNFDMPKAAASYLHRAGRTARAGKSGTVLTLVCRDDDEEGVKSMGKEGGCHIAPLAFRMDQIEAFRYRVEDALRMVTDAAVHGARLADVRREIVNSEQLKGYFEENPEDLDALRHNLTLAKNIPDHLAHIPSYLLPPALRGSVPNDPNGAKFRTKRKKRGARSKSGGNQRKRGDPLKTFTANGVSGSARERYREKHGIKKRKSRDPGQTMLKKRRRH